MIIGFGDGSDVNDESKDQGAGSQNILGAYRSWTFRFFRYVA